MRPRPDRIGDPERARRRPRPRAGRCGRAASTTSSASARPRAARDLRRRPPGSAATRSTTCSSPARRAWARPPWPASSPTSWGWACTPPPGRRWSARSTWPASSPTWWTATSSSSTRSTASTRRGGGPLPGHGGLQDGHHHRQGAGGALHPLLVLPFTLIGATTRSGLLTTPLRDRFGVCSASSTTRSRSWRASSGARPASWA